MTTQAQLMGKPVGLRGRLAALRAVLNLRRPWYSYYALLDGAQWYGMDQFEKGYTHGVKTGRNELQTASAGSSVFNVREGALFPPPPMVLK